MISLKIVSKIDHKFLYELLQEREKEINIIQKKIPSYEKHEKFVMSKPYSKWYVILYRKQKVGTIYLAKNNDVGVFLKKNIQKKGIGTIALNILIKKNPKKKYYAKINPQNKKSIKFFQKNNFNPIQQVLELKIEKQINYKNLFVISIIFDISELERFACIGNETTSLPMHANLS